MSQATIEQPSVPTEPLVPRFRLSGLMLLVLAAGLSLGFMSRAHVPVGAAAGLFWTSPATRWLGVAMAPVGVALGLTLAIQVFGLLGRRDSQKSSVWPISWRLLALALLVVLLTEESSLLPVGSSSYSSPNWPAGQIPPLVLETRLRLLPAVEGLMMIGLVLALRPRVARTARREPRLATWLRIVPTVLGGILIAAEMMIIPYLVLIAVEAVENAKMHPGEGGGGLLTALPRPTLPRGLADRLDGSVPLVGLALAVVTLAAAWVSSFLRRTTDGETNHGSWRDAAAGLALTAGCLTAASGLVFRAIPAIQPLALEGLRMSFGGWELAIVAMSFAFFSAGLVAHAVTPGIDPASGRGNWCSSGWNRYAARLAWAAMVVLLLAVIASSLEHIKKYGPFGRFIPARLVGLLDLLPASVWQGWTWLQGTGWSGVLIGDASVWFPAIVLPWLAWRSIGLLLSARSPSPAPLDRVFDSATALRRFFGFSFAMSVVLLAAVPTLALAGLVVLHHALRGSL